MEMAANASTEISVEQDYADVCLVCRSAEKRETAELQSSDTTSGAEKIKPKLPLNLQVPLEFTQALSTAATLLCSYRLPSGYDFFVLLQTTLSSTIILFPGLFFNEYSVHRGN